MTGDDDTYHWMAHGGLVTNYFIYDFDYEELSTLRRRQVTDDNLRTHLRCTARPWFHFPGSLVPQPAV